MLLYHSSIPLSVLCIVQTRSSSFPSNKFAHSHFIYFLLGDNNDPQFTRPRDLDLIQSTPLEAFSLKTPPRVLTLNERPLDFMEEAQHVAPDTEDQVNQLLIMTKLCMNPLILILSLGKTVIKMNVSFLVIVVVAASGQSTKRTVC